MENSPIKMDITKELESSYLQYACATLSDRAIPDIRDGLKPSQRRILISFRDLKLTSKVKHRKSALVVSTASGVYHPHGDQVIYPTMVRMAQGFSLRYPLVDGQGNYGNVGGSPCAAMRYTEARMSIAAEDILDEVVVDGNWTVVTTKNYDESRDEPTVLPSKFPNLLANGGLGLAVGWSTNIPPHNIKEVVSGLTALVRNKNLPDEDLLQHITGPDFPTGGVIHGTAGIRQLYTTGTGHLVVTGRVKIENKKGGTATITVYELPYGVATDTFLDFADNAFKQGRLSGDASSERMGHPIQVIFYLKRGEDPQVVLNQLYEHTPLKSTFAGNMIALVEGKDGDRIPSKTPLSLRSMMVAWIQFRVEVITKRTTIQLQTARKEMLRLSALLTATDSNNIDRVIIIIKEGADETEVISQLMTLLTLSEPQIRDILEITLRRLMKLERSSLQKQLDQRNEFVKSAESVLRNPALVDDIIIHELSVIEKAYGDNRLTTIEGEMKKLATGDLVPEEQVIVTLTNTGYIKRSPLESYRKTSRGTKGVIGATTNDDDYIVKVFPASTHDWLLAFTTLGMIHWLKVFDIPESVRVAKGRALVNLIKLQEGEKVTSIIPVSGEFDQREIVFGTALGLVKKTHLAEYGNPRNGGIVAIKLNDDDKLIGATLTDGKSQLLLITEGGQAIRVEEAEIASQGRNTAGRRGIKLKLFADKVCALLCIAQEDQRFVLTFTQEGVGKRTPISEYPTHHCGGSGVITSIVAGPETHIVTAALVNEGDEVMIVSDQGKAVRIPVKEIRISDRRTKGVRLIDLDEDQKLVSAAVITKED
jgi:DNA gyrase subunit A